MTLLLADENMPAASQKLLEQLGYDVKYIAGKLSGISDDKVIDIAIEEDRIIITFDSDFGELVFKTGYRPHGVIFFRWQSFRPKEPAEYIHKLFQQGDLEFSGYFTVIERGSIRQRPIP